MILGEKPELHISPGRPDVEPFQVLGFSPRTTGASSNGPTVPRNSRSRASEDVPEIEIQAHPLLAESDVDADDEIGQIDAQSRAAINGQLAQIDLVERRPDRPGVDE